MNQLTKVEPGSTALAPSGMSPFREFANSEAKVITGKLLKFRKGEWVLGENEAVSATTPFLANMNELFIEECPAKIHKRGRNHARRRYSAACSPRGSFPADSLA
jgi:hypothetical protein